MTDGSAVLTLERAKIIRDAYENWLKVGFHAGNNWQYYSLEHSTLRCYVKEGYEWKSRWTYNVIEVDIQGFFLCIRTDEGNVIMFKIDEGKSK